MAGTRFSCGARPAPALFGALGLVARRPFGERCRGQRDHGVQVQLGVCCRPPGDTKTRARATAFPHRPQLGALHATGAALVANLRRRADRRKRRQVSSPRPMCPLLVSWIQETPEGPVMARAERRLAAILAADVVGYSPPHGARRGRHARAPQGAPQGAPRPARSPSTAAAIVKLMGDGALCEFASVVDAVACAVAIQRGVAEREAGRARGGAHPLPHRDQPRRRDRRGRRRPLRRRRQRRRPAGAARRAGRDRGLGHRLRPPPGQARLRPRPPRRAAAQEHRAAGAGLPGRARRRATRSPRQRRCRRLRPTSPPSPSCRSTT